MIFCLVNSFSFECGNYYLMLLSGGLIRSQGMQGNLPMFYRIVVLSGILLGRIWLKSTFAVPGNKCLTVI